jgi:hypothetical protein
LYIHIYTHILHHHINKRYLSGEGGYAEEWQKAPPALRQEVRRRSFSVFKGTKSLLKSSRKMGGQILKASKKLLNKATGRGGGGDLSGSSSSSSSTDGSMLLSHSSNSAKESVEYFGAFEDGFVQRGKFGRRGGKTSK